MKLHDSKRGLSGEVESYEILHKAVNEVFENYKTIPNIDVANSTFEQNLEKSCERMKKMVAIMIDNQKKTIVEVSNLTNTKVF